MASLELNTYQGHNEGDRCDSRHAACKAETKVHKSLESSKAVPPSAFIVRRGMQCGEETTLTLRLLGAVAELLACRCCILERMQSIVVVSIGDDDC